MTGAITRSKLQLLVLISFFLFGVTGGLAQGAGTGALAGVVSDSTGAALPDVQIRVTNEATGDSRLAVSHANGSYVVPFLQPGSYRIEASKAGFRVSLLKGIRVSLAETETLNIGMQVGAVNETIDVQSQVEQLETESSSLGHVVNQETVSTLPLVTRNYTQILDLYPGVSADVTNAAQLGRGGMGTVDSPMVVHGGTASDNNFQMNGVEINDLQGSGTGTSGGIAVPNPDTIEEFKVQTGQYDAAYGRNAGANVEVVTKGGTNQFHGTLFEYFRNEALNANDYFLEEAGQPKPPLRQNQYGFTFGGPIKKDRLTFFTSYQGTKQLNGFGGGGGAFSCSNSFSTPPFTNDRSAAALGQMFQGQSGALGGVAVAADGSNINPVALALMQLKLPNGQYVIPTPQTVNPSLPFEIQGFSAISVPCTFNENQFETNADFFQTAKSKFSARFFFADADQVATFPATNFGGTAAPGFPQNTTQGYRNFSLTHLYTFSPNLINQAAIGYHRTRNAVIQTQPFTYSDIGVNVPFPADNIQPAMDIAGLATGGNAISNTYTQNTFTFQDSISYVRSRHTFRFGGGITHVQDVQAPFEFGAGMVFLSWPDFLLGQSGAQNGTGLFSNIIASIDGPGLFDRDFRVWGGNAYVQDDFRATDRLTFNLGIRYERLGDLADALGRNSNFYPNLLNPNPPDAGTLQGTVVAGNFSGGTVPAGVTRLDNDFNINGDGQNTFAPRFGFAWQLPHTNRVVLRGGYGTYYSRITGQPIIQELANPPWGILRAPSGPENADATLQNPFAPFNSTLPVFVPYSPSTQLSPEIFAPNMRPPITQQYSLNVQTDLGHNLLLEVGYVGARDTHLIEVRSFNQASLASASNPIRGETTNTLDNIPLRVPYEGFSSGALTFDTDAAGWYNALEASVNKRLSRGLQFLAAYTFSRDLTTDTGTTSGINGGVAQGDQNDPGQRYGPDNFIREHRLVVSYIYNFPAPPNRASFRGRLLGDWSMSGVTIYQSGRRLTLTNSNSTNVYGTETDRAEIAPGCTDSQLVTPGSIESKLNNYFNLSCLPDSPPVIGDDGVGTGFGNSGVGIVRGPGQANWDLSILKHFGLPWPNESSNLEFRAEFFNAFNHPQFAVPDTIRSDPSFGQITSLAVNPRIIQFALKMNF
jgi:Carboxypeptidase regulatory-like domain/TonB-dependent Receptor Plug Domain